MVQGEMTRNSCRYCMDCPAIWRNLDNYLPILSYRAAGVRSVPLEGESKDFISFIRLANGGNKRKQARNRSL